MSVTLWSVSSLMNAWSHGTTAIKPTHPISDRVGFWVPARDGDAVVKGEDETRGRQEHNDDDQNGNEDYGVGRGSPLAPRPCRSRQNKNSGVMIAISTSPANSRKSADCSSHAIPGTPAAITTPT